MCTDGPRLCRSHCWQALLHRLLQRGPRLQASSLSCCHLLVVYLCVYTSSPLHDVPFFLNIPGQVSDLVMKMAAPTSDTVPRFSSLLRLQHQLPAATGPRMLQ